MPGNLLDTDIYFPSMQGKNQNQINREVLDYLYMLQEQLRYSFGNIGVSNFNESELTALSVMITEPVYAALQDVDGNVAQLTLEARGLDMRLSDAEGNIDTVTATAETLSARLSTAEGDLTELSATASGLMGRIASAEGDITTLTATASGLSATVTGLSDNMSHTLRLGADGMTVQDAEGRKVIISNGNLNLSGAITFDDLQGTDAYDYDNARWTYTGLKGMVDQAQYNAANAKDLANSAYGQVNQWAYVYNGYTYIDGGQLMTGTVTASKLQGGEVDLLASNGRSVGGIDIAWTDTDDYGLSFHTETDRGGIRLQAAGNVFLSAHNEKGYILIGDPDISVNESILPSNDGQLWLGSSKYKWGAVYASSGTVQTSDRYLKHDIEPMPEKYTDMIDRLASVRYKYNDGTSNRYHTGFIAQDVKEAMDDMGIDSTEFGGWVADVDENSNPIYMLRYEEFIGILWNRVRELTEKIKTLEGVK